LPDPFKKLVATLENRLSGIAAQNLSGVPSELGTITEAGLKLDSFKYDIPDYLVAEWVTTVHFPAFSLVGTMTSPVNEDGSEVGGAAVSQRTRFDFVEAEVENIRLNWQAGMKPGDRVLAVPVNGGREAVVLCKVVNSGG